ncbi:helix-turn-helix domain-containing protein [Leifsonia poae]|uniref:helix-turn-helix domain-containing protein n=1 Tax=Leifsonia poae TaxID=110933 RepID=UPI001CBCB700|nr:helix-turn-helix transcriptional regulator [Leifsonia poae]
MLMRHAIGSVLRRLRLERGKTLRQLSEASRISLPYLSEVERGRKEASSEILATLCRVLDVTERELLARASAEFARSELTLATTGATDVRTLQTHPLAGSPLADSPRAGRPVVRLRVGGLRVAGLQRAGLRVAGDQLDAPAAGVEVGPFQPAHELSPIRLVA